MIIIITIITTIITTITITITIINITITITITFRREFVEGGESGPWIVLEDSGGTTWPTLLV